MSNIAERDTRMLAEQGIAANGSARTLGAHDWAAKIGVAQSEEQLIAVTNGYLATWLPSDFECLPAECRLAGVSNAEELAHFSVTFVKAELCAAHDAPASSKLVDLVRVFVAGQQRLRQLRSRKYDPSAG